MAAKRSGSLHVMGQSAGAREIENIYLDNQSSRKRILLLVRRELGQISLRSRGFGLTNDRRIRGRIGRPTGRRGHHSSTKEGMARSARPTLEVVGALWSWVERRHGKKELPTDGDDSSERANQQ